MPRGIVFVDAQFRGIIADRACRKRVYRRLRTAGGCVVEISKPHNRLFPLCLFRHHWLAARLASSFRFSSETLSWPSTAVRALRSFAPLETRSSSLLVIVPVSTLRVLRVYSMNFIFSHILPILSREFFLSIIRVFLVVFENFSYLHVF